VAGTEGNVSARTPGGNVLITPSGLDYAVTGPEDIVVVSLDGKTIEGSFKHSVETPLHTGITARDPRPSVLCTPTLRGRGEWDHRHPPLGSLGGGLRRLAHAVGPRRRRAGAPPNHHASRRLSALSSEMKNLPPDDLATLARATDILERLARILEHR
jgi:class II aldolase/adducin N-terminal domain-containing protein